MKNGFLMALLIFAGGLYAQPDIDVQYPAGTSLSDGQTINLGQSSNSTVHNLTFTIANTGDTDLTLTGTTPVTGGNGSNINWTIFQPSSNTVTDTTPVTFEAELTPNDDRKWNLLISIASDDPDENPFTVQVKGTQGEPPEDDDDDCSTGEGGGTSLLIIGGILCALVVATRLRGSRA